MSGFLLCKGEKTDAPYTKDKAACFVQTAFSGFRAISIGMTGHMSGFCLIPVDGKKLFHKLLLGSCLDADAFCRMCLPFLPCLSVSLLLFFGAFFLRGFHALLLLIRHFFEFGEELHISIIVKGDSDMLEPYAFAKLAVFLDPLCHIDSGADLFHDLVSV